MSTPQLVPLPGAGLMGLGGGVLRTRTVAPAPSPKPAPRAQVHHPARIEALPALPDGAATARRPPPAPSPRSSSDTSPSPAAARDTSALRSWEQVLLVLLDLYDANPLGPVDRGALAVECWRRWPDLYGLPGYPQYPDTSRVLPWVSTLMISKLAVSNGHQAWTPTPAGIRKHRALRARAGGA